MAIKYIIALIALIIASYIDLKEKEVPDVLSTAVIGSGITIALVRMVTEASLTPILESISGAVICLLIGGFMFYTGQWGGGDAKLMVGLGALFGFSKGNLFIIDLIILIIISGAVYGAAYSIYFAFEKRKEFIRSYKKIAYNNIVKKIRWLFLIILIFLITTSQVIIKDPFLRLLIIMLSAASYLLFHSWIFIKAIEEGVMKKRVNTSELVEGDWIIDEIKIKNHRIKIPKYGITKKDITLLKKNNIESVLIKDGIPFVPAFLIALIMKIILDYHGIKVSLIIIKIILNQ